MWVDVPPSSFIACIHPQLNIYSCGTTTPVQPTSASRLSHPEWRERRETRFIPLHWKCDTKDDTVVASFWASGVMLSGWLYSQSQTHEPGHLTDRKLHMITLTLGLDRSAEAIRTDGENISGPGSHASLRHSRQSHFLVLRPLLGRVCAQFPVHLCHRNDPVYGCIWLPTISSLCSEERRRCSLRSRLTSPVVRRFRGLLKMLLPRTIWQSQRLADLHHIPAPR